MDILSPVHNLVMGTTLRYCRIEQRKTNLYSQHRTSHSRKLYYPVDDNTWANCTSDGSCQNFWAKAPIKTFDIMTLEILQAWMRFWVYENLEQVPMGMLPSNQATLPLLKIYINITHSINPPYIIGSISK